MIEIQYDGERVARALRALAARAHDLAPAMRAIGAALRSDIAERFQQQAAPDGTAWQPLTAATIIARARRRAPSSFRRRRARTIERFAAGAKALLDTGQLRNSIRVSEVSSQSVTVSAGGGTRNIVAAIHHFGGAAGRGRRVRIPARPFMGISPPGEREILDIIARRLQIS